jgi:hypothetical protein
MAAAAAKDPKLAAALQGIAKAGIQYLAKLPERKPPASVRRFQARIARKARKAAVA